MAEDLELAAACLAGDPEALAAFDTLLRRVVHKTSAPERADEVAQRVRDKLLVGTEEPGLRRYDGRGRLEGWLRVVVARAEIDMLRATRTLEGEDALERWSEAAVDENDTDPELAVFKERYRNEFSDAFRLALDRLTVHQRNVLRQQLLFGLKLKELAALHDVSDRTIKRWLADARASLRRSTRDIMRAKLNLGAGDFTSIVRLIDSQMDAIALPVLKDSED